jgi:N-acylneuraminate cytidylyltransferase/CMP-N,N'-diacetyllegionaminic acid synthase
MYGRFRILALIAARGNSKGLPNKNILDLYGKPVIAWTIEGAQGCKYIDEIVVSTDSEEIAQIARRYGASVPFLRPGELAEDSSKIMDVIAHAISFLESEGQRFDIVVLLQPTCPLRSVEDVEQAIELLSKREAQAVVSVSATEHNPLWANTLPADGCMRQFLKSDIINKNRQELPTYYRLNGSIYLSFIEYWKTNKSFFSERTFAYIMPRERSVDIDTIIDFYQVQAIMKYKQ